MDGGLENAYDDAERADAYATLAFPGTYSLAFRDLPQLFARCAHGKRALDFGCGAGRSTRFLRDLGFDVSGIDISAAMLENARRIDPGGDYRSVTDHESRSVEDRTYDLILAAFTFDNIDSFEEKESNLRGLCDQLANDGCLVIVVSAPEIYVNEWASLTTKEYPANRDAASGERVLISMLDVEDQRPIEDVVCSDEDYRALFRRVGLDELETLRPLATGDEPVEWKSETTIPPWTVYALRPST